MTKLVILDSSVFNKIYLAEADRDEAIAFLQHARDQDWQLMTPVLFIYEVLAVAAASAIGAEMAYGLIIQFQGAGLQIVPPDEADLRQAIAIADHGHEKSGYPSLYDAAYHGLALARGGTFLTADTRHFNKTTAFGHIVLLRDWRSLMS